MLEARLMMVECAALGLVVRGGTLRVGLGRATRGAAELLGACVLPRVVAVQEQGEDAAGFLYALRVPSGGDGQARPRRACVRGGGRSRVERCASTVPG